MKLLQFLIYAIQIHVVQMLCAMMGYARVTLATTGIRTLAVDQNVYTIPIVHKIKDVYAINVLTPALALAALMQFVTL